MTLRRQLSAAAAFVGLVALGVSSPSTAQAHCDTLSGPVITAARKALETDNVNLVLIWVQPRDEAAVRTAFKEAVSARQAVASTRDAAESRFFDTLVRIHRAGEGAPFTGIKPADTDIGRAVPAADKALETGVVEPALLPLNDAVRHGVEKHFQQARERRSYDPNDVAAGRAFVKSYVEYTHFVEGIYNAATATDHHEHGPEAAHHVQIGHDHDGHRGHLPWALAGLFGLVALAEGGWMVSRRKRDDG